MGAHQYQLYLIPRSRADADPKWDDHWDTEQPPAALLAELRILLPKDTSWGHAEEFKSEREWGSDLRIRHDKERNELIETVEFRFSPIADDQTLLDRFLSAAAKFDMLVYATESERVLEPRLDAILPDLKSGLAFKFASDPVGAVISAADKLNKSDNSE